MDYQKEKDALEKELSVLDALNDAGLMETVWNIEEDVIYLKKDTDIDSTRRCINNAFGCASDRLGTYYMSHCGKYLVTSYRNESVRSIYYSSNVESLLKKISNGKCKVVELFQPEKTV